MKGLTDRRHLPSSDVSASMMSVLTTTGSGKELEAILPAQSIPTPSGSRPLSPSIAYRNLLSLSENTMKIHLVEVRKFFNAPEICAPCTIHGRFDSHEIDYCTEVAIGYEQSGSKYKTWKSKLDLPKGICYNCCYPQVSLVSQYRCNLLSNFFLDYWCP